MSRVKVLIVDDHALIRRGLREILVNDITIEVVAEAADGNEAVEKAKAYKPDVVLMDLQMPNCNGLEATRRLQATMPEVRVLVDTVSESESDLIEALRAGARGYLVKQEQPDMIVEAVHYVARGGIIISPPMVTKLLGEFKTRPRPSGEVGLPTIVESPGGARERTGEKAAAEPPAAERAPDALERTAISEAEPPAPSQIAGGEGMVKEAELVISAPVIPGLILNLHKWLKETTKAEIGKITAAWGGDTLMNVTFRDPTPLLEMLAAHPFVAQVGEDTHLAEEGASAGGPAEAQRPGPPRSDFKRLRLVLKVV